ncbi:zinc finger protein 184-like [Ochlerotatus camptorhynchus]|uniref:zinc finger protein 184-like n=1 Tax=Ochlerotatus camptorhynchus TaxID=644619 RepID=UPI0031E00B6C
MQCAVPSCIGWAKRVISFPQNLLLQSRWKRAIEAGTGLRIPTYHCGALCSWHFGDNQTETHGYWEPYRFLHRSGRTVEVGSCRFCLRFDERKKMVSDKEVLENEELVDLVNYALKINLAEDYILKDICEECEAKMQVVDKWMKSSKKSEKEYKALEIATRNSIFKPVDEALVPDRATVEEATEPLEYNTISFEIECMKEEVEIVQASIEQEPERITDERIVTLIHDYTMEEVSKASPKKVTKEEIHLSRSFKPIVKQFNFPANTHSKRGPPRRKPKVTQEKVSYREYLSKKCHVCDTLLDTPEDLVAHLTQQHCNGAPYKCSECDKSFKIITSYNWHLGFHDHSNRPLRCCYCTMGFKYNYSLLSHENRQHGASHQIHVKKKPTKRSFPCLKCDKAYKTNYDLLDHDRYVHQKLPGTMCKLCGKHFRNRTSLRKHHLVHTSERPYNCLHCDAVYRNITNLAKHVARSHAQDASTEELTR